MPPDSAPDDRLFGLIGRFYDAAADASGWAGIAGEIAGALDSTSAVLKLHGGGDDVRLLECTDNLHIPDSRQDWAGHWHRQDLWVERSAAFGPCRVVTDHDLVSPAEQRRSGFYREWLSALDIHHMVGAVFPADGDVLGVLGVHRPEQAGAYEDADRRKLSILLPHLQRALGLGRMFADAGIRQAFGEEALARIDAAVFAVDRLGRVATLNRRAETLVREADVLTLGQGRLALRDPLLQERMMRLVRACLLTATGPTEPPGSAMALTRTDRLPLTLFVAPLRTAMARLAAQPLALVMVRDPEWPVAATRVLRELFGLTRTEAVIAADLANGLSPDQVARRRAVGPATVRSHLKRILAKTGTHRQAEAVALIARSVAAFDRQAD